MQGWLVCNAYLNQNKYHDIYSLLVKAAKKQGIELVLKTNAALINYKGVSPDFVIFWDKDIRLAYMLEQQGMRLFNSARAIEICDDKALTYIHLYGKVKMPATVIAPLTYFPYENFNFIHELLLPFPVVVKECFGSFGAQVYFAENAKVLIEILKKVGTRPVLFQECIHASYGRDVRINLVGGEVVASMLRTSANGDFKANISSGGTMTNYSPTQKEIALAKKVSSEIGLDFCGVDLLFSDDDEPYLCEVNSNAHFKNIFDCTGIDVAEHIIKHIVRVI